jgi:two-component SAPR family response regulator
MRILIITTSNTQYDSLCLLLQTIVGQIECAHVITLEEGAATLLEAGTDLVLIDLASIPETGPQLVERLKQLHLEAKTVFMTDVARWHEWRRGPWANQVLLKGFSANQLQQALAPLTRSLDKAQLAAISTSPK